MDVKKHKKRRVFTEEELEELCEEYQELLRVQDWEVILSVVPPEKMTRKDRAGEIEFFPEHMDVKIRILDPESENVKNNERFDMRSILLHELLRLAFYDYEMKKSKSFDAGVNRVADALSYLLDNQKDEL